MDKPATKPDRTLLVILGVIGVIVIVALLVVFTRGEPALRDADTPEGVVQRYSAAVIAGDDEAAALYLVERERTECEGFFPENSENLRITLVSTTERASSADVRVSIITSYQGGPFGGSEYEFEGLFTLDLVDEKWLVDTAPWQLMICPGS